MLGQGSLAAGQDSVLPQNEDGLYEVQRVVNAEGTADELFSSALAWAASSYGDMQEVSQVQDREAHRLIIKGVYPKVPYMLGAKVNVRHTVTIETREGRARVTINGFQYVADLGKESPADSPFENPRFRTKRIFRETYERAVETINTVSTRLNQEEDDW